MEITIRGYCIGQHSFGDVKGRNSEWKTDSGHSLPFPLGPNAPPSTFLEIRVIDLKRKTQGRFSDPSAPCFRQIRATSLA